MFVNIISGTEVVEAKAGTGSATLSMAHAAAQFATSCLKAIAGEDGVEECSYVASNLTDLPFLASPVKLGKNGLEEFLPMPAMNTMEAEWFENLKPELSGNIDKGVGFIQN